MRRSGVEEVDERERTGQKDGEIWMKKGRTGVLEYMQKRRRAIKQRERKEEDI